MKMISSGSGLEEMRAETFHLMSPVHFPNLAGTMLIRQFRQLRARNVRLGGQRALSTATGRSVSVADDGAPGLFQLPNLHTPEDFARLTREAKLTCHKLRQQVLHSL